jgi:hypothetical protein
MVASERSGVTIDSSGEQAAIPRRPGQHRRSGAAVSHGSPDRPRRSPETSPVHGPRRNGGGSGARRNTACCVARRRSGLSPALLTTSIEPASSLCGCARDLFDSSTKFDSGTGWPSFWRPMQQAVATTVDRSWLMVRDRQCTARDAGDTWVTSSRMDRSQPGCDTASTASRLPSRPGCDYTTLDSDAVDRSRRGLRLASRRLHRHRHPRAAAQLPTMQPGWEKATFAMGVLLERRVRLRQARRREVHDLGLYGCRVSNPSYDQVCARIHRPCRSHRGRV